MIFKFFKIHDTLKNSKIYRNRYRKKILAKTVGNIPEHVSRNRNNIQNFRYF